MGNVRCKFYCNKIEKSETQELIKFSAVTDGSNPEDNTYSKYTPYGAFEIAVTNENVFGFFKEGAKYYLDITPASEAEAKQEAA